MSDKSRQKPTATVSAATIMADLKALRAPYNTAETRVLKDIANNACVALGTGCFAAGTKLLTKRGWVPVELLEVGDEVAARHESEPGGEVEWNPRSRARDARRTRAGAIASGKPFRRRLTARGLPNRVARFDPAQNSEPGI